MYDELYEVWRRELENADLVKIPSDLYSRLADYFRRLREEGRMLDKRTVKAKLLAKERQNIRFMASELIRTRYKKLIKQVTYGKKVPFDVLTTEEKVLLDIPNYSEAFKSFIDNIFKGHVQQIDVLPKHKRTVLRFVKDIPAIIGADMKTYGPFKIEDIASVPAENAKILVKQGMADNVETS